MQIGSMLGTIMVANVLMIIIPGQKKVVKSLLENKTPDAIHGITAKQRSLHNNYLTLPVIFIMISNHYPTIYATDYSWIIISLIIITGALIRQFFNIKHSGKKPPYLLWVPVLMIILFSVYLSEKGKPNLANNNERANAIIEQIPKDLKLASEEIIISKCSFAFLSRSIFCLILSRESCIGVKGFFISCANFLPIISQASNLPDNLLRCSCSLIFSDISVKV